MLKFCGILWTNLVIRPGKFVYTQIKTPNINAKIHTNNSRPNQKKTHKTKQKIQPQTLFPTN
jgi:hypothetical protein